MSRSVFLFRKILFLMIVFSATALQVRAQSSQPSPQAAAVGAAMAKARAGQTTEAEADLMTIAEENPSFVGAWSALGNLRRSMGKLPESRDAFQRAVELSGEAPPQMFNLGVAHGMLGELDDAFRWLEKARDSGAVLMANVDGSPAAPNLRADARYASLFPTREEYADPFVEDNRVIHDWFGTQRGEVFGWIARNIGDVDGDGIDDVTSSSPVYNGSTGRVYVYSGGTGKLLWTADGTVPGGRMGHGIEAAGDVNADGTPDVVAAAPYAKMVTVFDGRDGTEIFTVTGADTTGAFGLSVKGLGDVNGDGHSDILIGEPFQVWGAPINGGALNRPGRVHIISGKDQTSLFMAEGEAPGDGFGSSISGKSVDGGFMFVVGAPASGTKGTGKAYVYTSLDGTPHFTAEPDAGAGAYGSMFLSVIGDLNGDGTQDVYISDWGDNSTAPGAGKIYLYSGIDGSLLYSLTGEAAGDGYGIGISDAGDVNGDGYDDLVVGAWQHASAAISGGKLYIHSGIDGELLYSITGKVPGETLGFDTTTLGDVDGDGSPDFLVTSAYSSRNGFRTGRTLVISGAMPK